MLCEQLQQDAMLTIVVSQSTNNPLSWLNEGTAGLSKFQLLTRQFHTFRGWLRLNFFSYQIT